MPSLLAKAALAVLGATSGGERRLVSDVGPCTHDICGRRLVSYKTGGTDNVPHGAPKIYKRQTDVDADGNVVVDADGNPVDMTMADGKFVYEKAASGTSVKLDPNGIFVPVADDSATSYMLQINSNNKLEINVNMDATYNHERYNCELLVTPSVITDASIITAKDGSKTLPTSSTFAIGGAVTGRPDSGGNNVDYAVLSSGRTGCVDASGQVYTESQDSCVCESDGTTVRSASGTTPPCRTKKAEPVGNAFKVILDNPEINHDSLGYLGVDVDVKLVCDQKNDNTSPNTDEDGNAAYVAPFRDDYDASTNARVRFTYKEDPASLLPYQASITLNSALFDYTNKAHRNLPLDLAGTASLTIPEGQVRFPAGQWDTFGKQNPVEGDHTECKWDYDIDTDFSNSIQLSNWYNAGFKTSEIEQFYYEPKECFGTNGTLCNPLSTEAECEAQECTWDQKDINDSSRDILGNTVDCADETSAYVACGRKHTADLAWRTKHGFEVPLASYFSSGKTPKIVCTENTDDSRLTDSTKGESKDKSITLDETQTLGSKREKLVFGKRTVAVVNTVDGDGTSVLDRGESFFLDASTCSSDTNANCASANGGTSDDCSNNDLVTCAGDGTCPTGNVLRSACSAGAKADGTSCDATDVDLCSFVAEAENANRFIFKDEGLFTVEQSAATNWTSLEDTYDFKFQVKYDNTGNGDATDVNGDAVSTDSDALANLVLENKCEVKAGGNNDDCAAKFSSKGACEADNVADTDADAANNCVFTAKEERGVDGIQEVLAEKVQAFKDSKEVIRPRLYGQERTKYIVTQDSTQKHSECGSGDDQCATNDVTFRRDKAAISLALEQTETSGDGKVKYAGADANDDTDNVAFDGPTESWDTTLGSATIKSDDDCTYCSGTVNADADAVLLLDADDEPNPSYDSGTKEFTFFKALGDVNTKVADLFETAADSSTTCGLGTCTGAPGGCTSFTSQVAKSLCEAESLGSCRGQVVDTAATCKDGSSIDVAGWDGTESGCAAPNTYTAATYKASALCDSASQKESQCTGKQDEGNNDCVWKVTQACTFEEGEHTSWCASSTGGRTAATCKDASDNDVALWDGTEGGCAAPNTYTPDTAFQCKDQSVTYTLTVGKLDKDDRVHDTLAITKTYEDKVVDADAPDLPVVAADNALFILAGTAPAATISRTAEYKDERSIDAITFNLQDSANRAYSANKAPEAVAYKADYKDPCTNEIHQISHSIDHCVVYSDDQVTPQNAVREDVNDVAFASISEHSIQRASNNIEFKVLASNDATYGLKFSQKFQVKATSSSKVDASNTYEKTVGYVANRAAAEAATDGGCWLLDSGNRAQCILKGFKDVDFDKDQTLGDGVACDSDNTNADTNVPDCPKITLEFSDQFVVPDHGSLNDAFSVADGDQQSCASTALVDAKRHVIGGNDITILVDGSDSFADMYSNKLVVKTFNKDSSYALSDLGTANEDNGDDAVGANGEYITTIDLGDAATQAGRLQEDMSLLRLQLTLEGDEDANYVSLASKISYRIENNNAAAYTLVNCNNLGLQFNPDSCESAYTSGNDGGTNKAFDIGIDPVAEGADRNPAKVLLIVDDVGKSGADPCHNDLLGDIAHGNKGVEIKITKIKAGVVQGQPHIYEIPIQCHTEHSLAVVDVSVDPTLEADASAWNKKKLTLTLTGSGIDASKQVGIKETQAQVLQTNSDDAIYASRDTIIKNGVPKVELLLNFQTTSCGSSVPKVNFYRIDGSDEVAIKRSDDGADYEYKLVCPANNFGITGIDANTVHPLNKNPQLQRFGDIFLLKDAKIQGRTGDAIGTDLTLTSSHGTSTGESIFFYVNGATQTTLDTSNSADPEKELEKLDITFKIVPALNQRIKCQFITIELSSKTTDDSDSSGTVTTFEFDVPCPRTQYAAARTDELVLDYDVTSVSFNQLSSEIVLPQDPAGVAGVSSVIALGKCAADNSLTIASEDDTGACVVLSGGDDATHGCASKSGGSKSVCESANTNTGDDCVFTPDFPDTKSDDYGTCSVKTGGDDSVHGCAAESGGSKTDCEGANTNDENDCIFVSTVNLNIDENACSLGVNSNILDDSSDDPLVASDVMRLFKHCGGDAKFTGSAAGVGAFDGTTVHEATVMIARSYTHEHALNTDASNPFIANKFCEETPVRIQAMKSQDKSARITVAGSQNMDFELQISKLEFETCDLDTTDADTADGLRLNTEIEMYSRLGSNTYQSNVQTFYRSASSAGVTVDGTLHDFGPSDYSYFKSDGSTALSGDQDAGDSTLVVKGPCQDPDAATFDDSANTITYTMFVESNSIVYFAQASVEVEVSKPEDEQQALLTFDASDLSINIECESSGNAFNGDCVDANGNSYKDASGDFLDIPSDFNVKATIVVGDDEDNAFDHEFSDPQIRDATTLADLQNEAYTNVKDLGSAYQANTGVAQPLVSSSNAVVQVNAAQFQGGAFELKWTVTRIEKARRLRQLLTVTYQMGADGSVEKSTSLSVAPAIRESGEQPATQISNYESKSTNSDGSSTTTIMKKTVTKDDDGKETVHTEETSVFVDPSDPTRDNNYTVVSKTTRDSEDPLKENPDHTAAWFGAIAGGVSAVGVAAIAIIYAIKSSGSSGAAVALQPGAPGQLWNRNRFAPGDF